MVVSGAPEKEINHAEKVCDMALDMIQAITDLKDPSTGRLVVTHKTISTTAYHPNCIPLPSSHLKIRVGVHSGAVVAGIVGLKVGSINFMVIRLLHHDSIN